MHHIVKGSLFSYLITFHRSEFREFSFSESWTEETIEHPEWQGDSSLAPSWAPRVDGTFTDERR